MIVYDSSNYLDDLLYFWNRQRYISPKNTLPQILISKAELTELLKNKNLELLLFRINYSRDITLTSCTITDSELKNLKDQIQQLCSQSRITYSTIPHFPYEVKNIKFKVSEKIKKTKHLIIGKADNINLLGPVFNTENNKIDG